MMKEETKKTIDDLLTKWGHILIDGRINSEESAKSNKSKRIHRIKGPPIIWDRKFSRKQRDIQEKLAKLLPQYKKLINSQPELFDNKEEYRWKTMDYIELYFGHYELLISK